MLSLVTFQVLQGSPLPLALQPLPPSLKHLSLFPLTTLLKHHPGGDLPHHCQASPTVQRGAEEEEEEEGGSCVGGE